MGFTGGFIADSMKEKKYNNMMTDIWGAFEDAEKA